MTASNATIKEIFGKALEIESAAERAAFVADACGNSPELRAELESLLSAVVEAGSFMDGPAVEVQPTIDQPITEAPGSMIGPYKILQEIGEGGFGVVYMAEQMKPVRRKVALKIVKPGMDTKEVIARFEAERQALAMMDHPNVARVLDAGATASGGPYFVMDLVKGVSITEYCDDSNLTTKDRLKLFEVVCRAVQHAHQKGIIHRDIKPSNVMVTLHDGEPVPKVIDFGVSKALNQQLTEKTLFTRYGQMIGTPQYMSPEQAEMSGLDVDTRSDIYSLGVLLYELLAGGPPFDAETLRRAGFDEVRRMIRETEPPKPSTRVRSFDNKTATAVADHRQSQPVALDRLLRGDLDWIVMMALDKDRSRRYETATGLANDIQRHLANEPVIAGPPTVRYRLKKFVRRNRSLVATAAAVTLVVLVGFATSVAGFAWANVERKRAVAAEAQVLQALKTVEAEKDKVEKAARLADQALQVVNVSLGVTDGLVAKADEEAIPDMLARIEKELDNYGEGDGFIEANVRYLLGRVYRERNLTPQAHEQYDRALAFQRSEFGDKHPKVGDTLARLADLHWRDPELSELYIRESLDIALRSGNEASSEIVARRRVQLAAALLGRGSAEEALPLAEKGVETLRANGASAGWEYYHLAKCYSELRRSEEAEKALVEATRMHREASNTSGLYSAHCLLGDHLNTRNKDAEAVNSFRQAKIAAENLNDMDCLARSAKGLGDVQRKLRNCQEAESSYRASLKYRQDSLGPLHASTLWSQFCLAQTYKELGKDVEAAKSYRELASTLEDAVRNENPIWGGWKDRAMYCYFLLACGPTEEELSEVADVMDEAIQLKKEPNDFFESSWDGVRALLFEKRGKLEQAVAAARRVHEKAPAKYVQPYRHGERVLVRLLRARGDLEAAEAVLRSGLAARRDALPTDHPEIAYAEADLAEILLEKQEFEETEKLLSDVRTRLLENEVVSERNKRLICQLSARLYREWGKPELAAKWKTEAESR